MCRTVRFISSRTIGNLVEVGERIALPVGERITFLVGEIPK
jgi:hypothetical protein